MLKYLRELINSNYYFLSLICFVAVIPLSQALVSIMAGVVLITALIEDNWANKKKRALQRKVILLVPLIFLLYLLSTLLADNGDKSFYDVQKTMFYLVFPIAFLFGKEINSQQKRFIFFAFSFAVLIAILIAMLRWKLGISSGNFAIHKISLISHIRFSFQIILVMWFVVFYIQNNYKNLSNYIVGVLGLLICIYLGYLFLQQSLTGIIALGGSVVFFLFFLLRKSKGFIKVISIAVLVIFVVAPCIYLKKATDSFYKIEKADPSMVDSHTASGNRYVHDFNNLMVENGHYVYLYVCNKEMREEWNKLSSWKFDSLGTNGYPISATLTRYLTSKGLRKDAEGIKALSTKDIGNIENGMANEIFQKKFSLYPRIYLTIWEYYTSSNTGYTNHQSFSQRIEFAKAALTIIKKYPLFGVGTQNWRDEFAIAFKENSSQLDESLYASSHNQYLNYLVKFGIIGFLVIMVLLIYPIVKSGKYRDPFFMIFLTFMFLANLADSNLESHMGSSFFFFFYCLFITSNAINYLKIDNAE